MLINWDLCFGFDLETHGDKQEYALQPFRLTKGQAKIKAYSAANSGQAVCKLWPEKEDLKRFFDLMIKKKAHIVGWNVVFDIAWCVAAGLEEEAFAANWLDGMLLWRHNVVEPEGEDIPATKRKKYSLEACMKEFAPDEASFKEFTDFQATDGGSIEKLIHRNKMDAHWTLFFARKFWHSLQPEQQVAAFIESRCLPMMAKTRVLGIRSSREEAEALSIKLEAEAEALYADLLSQSPEAEGLNLGSPKQLQTLLYEKWGLPATRFSRKTGDPSTDKYALFDLAALDSRAATLKNLREAKNNRKKYAIGTLNSLEYNGDGFVRPQAKPFSTYTSRITYGSSDKAVEVYIKTTKKSGPVECERNVEVPVGIALHQWKRGKEYRRLIKAPEGYDLAEFDFAGQEFRWMAVGSRDETMLSLCAPGEDAHGYMGAQVSEEDYRELVRLNKEGDAHAALQRKCGKFCISEGQLVLTDRGLIPIEKISLADRVWDGVEWVYHEGLIFQGVKKVMTYEGLTATPDHKVYLQDGRRVRLDQAEAEDCSLAIGERGGEKVQFLDNSFSSNIQIVQTSGASCPSSMFVRCEESNPCSEFSIWKIKNVQTMCFSREASKARACNYKWYCYTACAKTMQRNETEVPKSKRSILQELRSERYSVQVCISCRSNCLCVDGVTSSIVSGGGYRSKGQQWSLRTWEFKVSKSNNEYRESQDYEVLRRTEQYTNFKEACLPCAENLISRSEIYRSSSSEFRVERTDYDADCRKMASTKFQTKRVYDIANAGPRNRFTVSGKIVSNCNLSYQYRVSAKTATVKARVEYEMDVDEAFIANTQRIYLSSYVGVPRYWNSQIYTCKSKGYAETFAGRRVQLRGNWASKRERWGLESTAINYPIQGTGGDQKYLALAIARNLLPQFGGYFYYELHDGLFFIFPHNQTAKAAPVFLKELSNLPYKKAWGVDLPIQFPVDGKIGSSWGDLKDMDKWMEENK